MACKVIKTRDFSAIVCSRGGRPIRCTKCGRPANRLCDWPVLPGKTCDKGICASCSYQPELGTDYCPDHAAAHARAGGACWRRRRLVSSVAGAAGLVVGLAVANGIPVPAMSSALAYYDGYRRDRLPANLLQSQRDYFGAHTYERTDKPGVFHAEWLDRRREPRS